MSREVVVRYRVKADSVEQNLRLVRAVYDELAATRPEGFRYNTYRVDETTFVHVASIDGADNPLNEVAAFRAFTAGINERCEEPPLALGGEAVGSYPR